MLATRGILNLRVALLMLVCSGLMPTLVSAQQTGSSHTAILAEAARKNWELRITLPSGEQFQGPADSFFDSARNVPLNSQISDQLLRIERMVTNRSASMRGALIGAGVGLLGAVAVAIPFCEYATERDCPNGVRLGLTGLSVGAITGALAGGLFSGEKWLVVWPDTAELK